MELLWSIYCVPFAPISIYYSSEVRWSLFSLVILSVSALDETAAETKVVQQYETMDTESQTLTMAGDGIDSEVNSRFITTLGFRESVSASRSSTSSSRSRIVHAGLFLEQCSPQQQ